MTSRRSLLQAALAGTALLGDATPVRAQPARRPNILFMLADNLGYGELGVYGGGRTRGAATPRIDRLAAEGLRLTNMNMEAQCTPSRSAILTGRYAIRSGTHSVPFGGVADGLTQWEVTLAESLGAAGYASALFGKWHLGSEEGRFPTNQGFDEWYGIPRTTDEAMWPGMPGWSAAVMPPEQILEGRKGERTRPVRVYDLEQRRLMDAEIARRTVAFMEAQAHAGKPFFAYATLTQPHLPTLPHPEFAGRTGNGDWADMLAEMDANVGRMLDAVDRLGLRENTIVLFASDNGPEFVKPWDGWAGPWRGQYFTAWEGGIRVPCIVRWPERVPAGRVSDAIVHAVDLFPTLAKLAGASVPGDRPIDGVDQSPLLLGQAEASAREGILVFCAERLQAVKWRNYKVHFYRQDTMVSPAVKLGIPLLFNLYQNPREDEDKPSLDSWVVGPVLKLVAAFEASLKAHPLIPMGTPDPYKPPR
ncbi:MULTISPECIES: arylsulfatase [Ramlibacter]|uniref:Sulfatase-like hydrolase/transferase n=1 Tax=Ramlibacter pinisoli TaxID=2682844 RepID=A0A6N8IQC0_9BURK|nr:MULTISPECIES: arylsulfatase [Ramlibacter]MBA2963789.1 arylsulfatase [Ramlibacter sp. CGMCC 1.13660]MVQ28755.1 sulfatase-like hydrolase/transferase [Ramlibacter pinisoli]